MTTLDRSRSFITVCPPTNGVSFRQDHVDFDGQDRPVAQADETPATVAVEDEIAPGVPRNWRDVQWWALKKVVRDVTGEDPLNKKVAIATMERWLAEKYAA